MNKTDEDHMLSDIENMDKEEYEEGQLTDESDDLIFNINFKERQNSDKESEHELSEDESDLPELETMPNKNILDSLLAGKSKIDRKKNKKSRATNNDNAEPEFMLPDDLDEKLRRINLDEEEPLKMCGTMILRIEDTQTITFSAAGDGDVMDLGSAIFDSDRTMIGIVGYIFGTSEELCYQLICKDVPTCDSLSPGDELFCAPGAKEAFFKADHTENAPEESDEDFSDDEKQRQHELKKNGAKTAKKRPAPKNDKKKRLNTYRDPFVVAPLPRATPILPSSGYLVPSSGYNMMPPMSHQPRHNSTMQRPLYNSTMQRPLYNATMQQPLHNATMQRPLYNATVQQPPFNLSQPPPSQYSSLPLPSFNVSQPPPFYSNQLPSFNVHKLPPFNVNQPPPFNMPPPAATNNAPRWMPQQQWPPRSNQ